MHEVPPLIEAIWAEDSDEVERLLNRAHDPDVRDEDGKTALVHAVDARMIELVNVLLENGADPNLRVENERTALHEACRWATPDFVKALLNHGADANALDESGCSPLLEATAGSSLDDDDVLEMAVVLIKAGADPRIQSKAEETPLTACAVWFKRKTAEYLLYKGADANWRDSEGRTAMFYAASSGDDAMVWLLLRNRGNPDAKMSTGETPLMRAIQSRHFEVAALLARHTKMPDHEDELGRTAMSMIEEERERLNLIERSLAGENPDLLSL